LFDRSYLPPAETEFVVIADTHYMVDPGDRPLEFESRRKQTHRSRAALELVHALGADFAVHMGDLVQEYPETEDFPQALDEALAQIDTIGLTLNHCAGNHDVGDKPDPSMPTHPVTPEGLAYYHQRVGKSWYSFDSGEHHIVVINSQLLNTNLPEATEQQAWLETDLRGATDRRIALFLHLPPYLFDRNDQAFGNYDVIEEPARSWVLGLLDHHQVEVVCAAHVHFAFFDRLRNTNYHIMPSPAFTRPGFSHLFTSAPPPEHGRDDTPKLAFYLFRSGTDFLDRHVVRTSGKTEFGPGSIVVTRSARSLPSARFGVTLTHTPTPKSQVPLAYPSIVRQTVRNDYPLLTCQEMGLRHLRAPISDILDEDQNRRLQILRDSGTLLTGVCVTRDPVEVDTVLAQSSDRIDGLEIQTAKADLPTFTERPQSDVEISFGQVDPSERVTGKQHLRTRVGFPTQEAHVDHPFDRTVVSIATWESANLIQELISSNPSRPLDITLDLIEDDQINAERVASACLLTACLPDARLFCLPYLDLDRTMDVSHGFLDTLCNPRPVVNVYRMLNTILFSSDEVWQLKNAAPLTIRSQTRELTLSNTGAGDVYDLVAGTRVASPDLAVPLGLHEVSL
jgi:hypothetical protein